MNPATIKYLYRNGQLVPANFCVQPDHYVTTLQVTIRSSSPVGIQTLRDRLQAHYEVIGIVQGETVCIVGNTPHAS